MNEVGRTREEVRNETLDERRILEDELGQVHVAQSAHDDLLLAVLLRREKDKWSGSAENAQQQNLLTGESLLSEPAITSTALRARRPKS